MKIAFTRSNGLGAKLIRWFTKSEWSHCLIVLDDDVEGESLCLESSLSGGVKLSLWSKHKQYTKKVYTIKKRTSIKPLYPYIGRNYGYLQILGYPIAKLFKLKENPFKKDFVCSEIVLRFLLKNKFQEFAVLNPDIATPEDIHKLISKSSNFQLI